MARTEACCVCADGWLGNSDGSRERCPTCKGFRQVAAGTFTQKQREIHAEVRRLERLITGEGNRG